MWYHRLNRFAFQLMDEERDGKPVKQRIVQHLETLDDLHTTTTNR